MLEAMAKTTCEDCHRTVFVVQTAAGPVTTDPELISVVTAKRRADTGAEIPGGAIRMSATTTFARRLHAERCTDYQEIARKERLSEQMRAFTARQKREPRARRKTG